MIALHDLEVVSMRGRRQAEVEVAETENASLGACRGQIDGGPSSAQAKRTSDKTDGPTEMCGQDSDASEAIERQYVAVVGTRKTLWKPHK